MKLEEFHADLQALAVAKSTEEIAVLCRRYGERLGLGAFVYALRVPPQFADAQVVMVQTYPVEWTDRYWDQGYYSVDPVINYCANHITPITWDKLAPIKPLGGGERMMNEAGDFGLRAGVTMPVHSPHGELGILSYALDRATPEAWRCAEQSKPYVQLMGGYLHEAMRRVSRVSGLTDALLSGRELECLRWVADGKSSWEIGRLLNLSERTVNFHIERSMAKLNVCNRQHAIAKAIISGLLTPRPF